MKRSAILFLSAVFSLILLLDVSFGQSEQEAYKLIQKGKEARIQDKFHESLGYFEKALEIFRNLEKPFYTGVCLSQIGDAYHSLGLYRKGMHYHQKALIQFNSVNSPKPAAFILRKIGHDYRRLGRYDMALKNYRQALEMFQELDMTKNVIDCLRLMGLINSSVGRYDEGLAYLEMARDMGEELNQPLLLAHVLRQIGKVYTALGRFDEALKYYHEALKTFREFKMDQLIAGNLKDIGIVYYILGRYDEALKYFNETLVLFSEYGQPTFMANSLDNLGMVYLALKDYRKAEEFFERAISEKEKDERIRPGNTNIVELYLETGRYEKALLMLNRMKPKWFTGTPFRTLYHTQRGLALRGTGKLPASAAQFLKAVELIEEMRQSVKGERTEFFGVGLYGGRVRAYRGLVSSLAERVIRGEQSDPDFDLYGRDLASASFYFSESTKARVFMEAMAESHRQHHDTHIPGNVRRREQSLLNQLSAVESQWEEAYALGKASFDEIKERKKELISEFAILKKEIRQKYPEYAALFYPLPIPPEELPLRDDEILLAYAIGDESSYLFKVKKGGTPEIFRIPEGRNRLEALVKKFTFPLQEKQRKEAFSPLYGQELYSLLLERALRDISSDQKLIIVPDGILGLVPYEALVIERGENYRDSVYVGDLWNITYSQSATVFAFTRLLKPSQASSILFALGNPVYSEDDPRYTAYKEGTAEQNIHARNINRYAFRNLSSRLDGGSTTRDEEGLDEIAYAPLPETEAEVKAIAGLFGVEPVRPDILLDVWANESNLRKSSLHTYRYLHFATHADLPGKVQGIQEPFLLLGQVGNKAGDDGFLTLTEVLGLHLDAELVVLSACLTGRGKMVEGEGVVNFARAFQHAGARSIVVSLWTVASDETVEYMKVFYEALKGGKTKAGALSQARKEIKQRHPNPFFWAPFILHGKG